ncbi:hypothetical protein [Ornithinimicrobium faecis]|uniref:Uncharacterized protein n=1 Tax=Ornithinimicrobium faecis TaxID=2934158 RepID=A0ABY4YR07_9MICO|nr:MULTISPECIES: hypothetical protein [unclassified Ornithinimicrobium]USQ78945.1 hypothetical protein NF556_15105 [Ornithinimicrobium sp. HY1793]
MRDLIEDLKTLSPEQTVLRGLIVFSLLGFALVLVLAGESSVYALVVLVILGGVCVLNPHTVLPAAVMIYCLATWWAGVSEPLVPWATPAALCLLLLHTACALTAAAPAQARIPRQLFGQYAVRLAIVAGATVALSLVAWVHQSWGYGGGLIALTSGLFALGASLGVYYWAVTLKQDHVG